MLEFTIMAVTIFFFVGVGFGLLWGHAMGVRDTLVTRGQRITITRRDPR